MTTNARTSQDPKPDSLLARLRDRFERYLDTSAASAWLSQNTERVQALFSPSIRDFVFEPIRDVFTVSGRDTDSEIRAIITRVAVANAVLAGLPGKMGVGVAVAMALEGWMAYSIAKRIGLKIENTRDIWKYFSLFAGVAITIIWIFRVLLGFVFSLVSVLPGLNPLILAELIVTNFVGVCFWVGFEQARNNGNFNIPKSAALGIARETRALYSFQADILKRNLNPSNLKLVWARLTAWLRGDLPANRPELRGEVFATAAMAYLVAGKVDELQGPLGQEFIRAIQDRYPELSEASLPEIADFMSQYDAAQLAGVINMVKGKLFERLVAKYENGDDDSWTAHLHDDQSYPGSDVIFTNMDTGESIELSLKATGEAGYIESALLKYPDTPIMTTDEVAGLFGDNELVFASGLSNADLTSVTEQNFDTMLERITPIDALSVATMGVAAGAMTRLWPFVVAYLRKRISYERLQEACVHVMGDSGKALASRLGYAALFGPLFAWYLLARGTMGIVRAAEQQPPYRLNMTMAPQPAF